MGTVIRDMGVLFAAAGFGAEDWAAIVRNFAPVPIAISGPLVNSPAVLWWAGWSIPVPKVSDRLARRLHRRPSPKIGMS